MTNCRLQARNFITQDGTNGIKRMKRYTSAIPLSGVLSAGSMDGSIKQLTASEASDLESTATSSVKKRKIEVINNMFLTGMFYFIIVIFSVDYLCSLAGLEI